MQGFFSSYFFCFHFNATEDVPSCFRRRDVSSSRFSILFTSLSIYKSTSSSSFSLFSPSFVRLFFHPFHHPQTLLKYELMLPRNGCTLKCTLAFNRLKSAEHVFFSHTKTLPFYCFLSHSRSPF